VTGWRVGRPPAENARAVTPLGGAAFALLAGGMKARKTGAAFAYLKARDMTDPSGTGVAPCLSGGGWPGMSVGKNAARRKARAMPVHGAAEMAGGALA